METKGITCKIPLDLHNRISEEIRETESTISKFIEMVIRGCQSHGKRKNISVSGERGIVPEGKGIP